MFMLDGEKGMNLRNGVRVLGIEGRRWMVDGVEKKEILRPLRARLLESSKKGRIWPMANQGTITI
ncbi:hypothetical protein IEQ34_000958 [Dendrobium chrysotoxum]|uniref:Uncharacterized protein n=1 Tax=Dendrobium chrysotoxum TaxID=161865 RepID=A0AAV7HQ58_DENCH|nr:hypothetical protein IEQ34_000958 [Dendrobium chrysotoxum]